MNSPPPQRSCHTLVDDAIREILLRVPPDEPASLVRASAVCTTWLEIISDPAFFRDYRAFHGAPPVLGYLHNKSYESHGVARFDPTGAFCPLVRDRRNWHAADSRHGRVLFYTPREKHADFVVWDPITDRRWGLLTDPKLSGIIETAEDQQEEITWMAAVLCAQDGCDHLGCHDGPFLVAFAGSNELERTTFASFYSSEAAEWSEMISIENPNATSAMEETGHTAVVGNKVYFPRKWSRRIVMYDVGEQELSAINLQDQPCGKLMGEEDGALVFASMGDSKLYVRLMEDGPNGVVARGQRRVVELQTSLPPSALSSTYWMVRKTFVSGGPSLVGFASGAGVIFLNTEAGLFTVEVCTGQTKKVHRKMFVQTVIPYVSFYSREHVRIVMPLQSKRGRGDHSHELDIILHDHAGDRMPLP
ncbi:hypothetical protein ACQJBY_061108 [Aegilops geniculata]